MAVIRKLFYIKSAKNEKIPVKRHNSGQNKCSFKAPAVYTTGPGCSKLRTSLVNALLKFHH